MSDKNDTVKTPDGAIPTPEIETHAEVELLPCPLCGSAVSFAPYKRNGLLVKCPSCLVQISGRVMHQSLDWLKGKMTKRWNRRPVATDPCTWTHQSDEMWDVWETSCDNIHVFETGTPTENKQKFCGYCGKVLIEAATGENK